MKVYLKMRNGSWMLITKKIEQVSTPKRRRTSKYVLAGEKASPPRPGRDLSSFEIPASVVNKLVYRLLEIKGNDEVAIIEPTSLDRYVVKVGKLARGVVEEFLRSFAEGPKGQKGRETS